MDFPIVHHLAKSQHGIKAPLVFSHMDFHRLNRLVRETTLPNGEIEKEFYFVDLDSSLYSYRGYDFAAFFDSLYQIEPYFRRDHFVSDNIILKFLKVYREECGKIQGQKYLDDPINSLEQMLREVKFFVLNYATGMMFFAAVMFVQSPDDEKSIEMITGTHKRMGLFKKLLKRFHAEGILPTIPDYKITMI